MGPTGVFVLFGTFLWTFLAKISRLCDMGGAQGTQLSHRRVELQRRPSWTLGHRPGLPAPVFLAGRLR